jgi:hypothetical protein
MTATTKKVNRFLDPRSETKAQPSKVVKKTRLYLTLTMGVFIPLFSLTLSHIGGTLVSHSGMALLLGLFAFSLMACVLAVSLSHLAWAVQDITRSPRWAAWFLAVSFDLALVLGELCHVAASEAGVGTIVTILMIAVCLLSMFLNCWAFCFGPHYKPSKPKKKKI